MLHVFIQLLSEQTSYSEAIVFYVDKFHKISNFKRKLTRLRLENVSFFYMTNILSTNIYT